MTVAASLAALALGLLGYQYLEQPTTLRVAVGPLGSEDTRLVTAMAQYLAREKSSVRLKLVMTAGVGDSARSLEAGRAEVAVVRSDVAIPAKSQTIAILHRDAAVLAVPATSSVTRVAELAGRRIGIPRNGELNTGLLAVILGHYGLSAAAVAPVPLESGAEVEAALREDRIDAVLVVGTLTGRTMTESVAGLGALGGPPHFVPVGEAAAIAQRSPAHEAIEVVRGVFGGTPSRPAEPFTTLGVSHRLVGATSLEDAVVSELTRLLFAMRPAISAEVPLANRIEAPEVSKSASLPVHPGALAYYDGEILTFFERYGDWFYLGVMALSILGSAAAGLVSRAANRSRARDMALLSQLLGIVRAAHEADDAGLAEMEARADGILAAALDRAGGGGIDNAGVAAFTLGLDQARRAISERRKVLREERALGEPAAYASLPRAAE